MIVTNLGFKLVPLDCGGAQIRLCGMNNENWEEAYRLAVLEVDGRKMPERISVAHMAIAGRLQEIEGDSDHHGERERIEDALRALKVLTTESQGWQ